MALSFLLILWGSAGAEQQPCVVCSADQSRIHLEDCSLSSEWQGRTYYFCRQGCQETFLTDPEKWAAAFVALGSNAPSSGAEGEKFPDFDFPLEPAGRLSSKDLSGKVLVINYWAGWCGPCLQEMPELVKLQDELGDRGLLVVGLSFDRSKKTHRENIQKLGLNFPSIYADQPAVKAFLEQLDPVRSIPVTFVVDGEGKIVKRIGAATTYDELRAIVEPLLTPTEGAHRAPPKSSAGSVVPS